MAKTRSERETILRFTGDPEEALTVYTHKERLAKRLLKAGGVLKRDSKIDGEVVSWTVECPREWFREPRPRRKASPAQLAAIKESLAKAREGRESLRGGEPAEGEGAS